MNKLITKVFLFSIIFTVALFSCKREEKKNLFLGKWDLIYWDNQLQDGVFVFRDSTAFFNIFHTTEMLKYKINKDTIRFQKVGGTMQYLSSYDYWLIKSVDSVFFKIESSTGNITTAHKKTAAEKALENDTDTVAIKL